MSRIGHEVCIFSVVNNDFPKVVRGYETRLQIQAQEQ